MEKKLKWLYILLFFCGIGIIGYNFYIADQLKYDFEGDAGDFIHLGLSLAKTGKYGHLKDGNNLSEDFKLGAVKNKKYHFSAHSTWRPPIWPFIIAISFLISGYSITFLIVLKFLLHILGCLFFYKSLKYLELKDTFIAIGVFLYLINPAWQLYSRVFLSEPITLFFISTFIWATIRLVKIKKGWLLTSIIGGIAVLSHPYYIFLPFALWIILALFGILKIKKFLYMAGICSLVIGSWVVRNYLILDSASAVLTTSSGAVMAKGWNSKVPELHTNTKGDLADETLVLKDYDFNPKNYKGETGGLNLYKEATLNFIKKNPDLIIPIIWKKLKSAFNPFPETPRPGILETGRVIYQVLALLAMLIILFKGNALLRSLVLGLITATIFITIIIYSGFRFRMPQTSLEILFITYAIYLILSDMKFIKRVS